MSTNDLIRHLKPNDIHHLQRENPRELHDANVIIACLLLQLGGGATISAAQFAEVEAAGLGDRIDIKGEQQGEGVKMHFRVRV